MSNSKNVFKNKCMFTLMVSSYHDNASQVTSVTKSV